MTTQSFTFSFDGTPDFYERNLQSLYDEYTENGWSITSDIRTTTSQVVTITDSNIRRYYVDGTNGNDSNDGESWGNAWKTADRLMVVVNVLLASNPNALIIESFARNIIAAGDWSSRVVLHGTSRFYFGQHIDDMTSLLDGTIAAVGGEVGPPKHGKERLTLSVAPAAIHLGRTLLLEDPVTGTNRATCTIDRVDVANKYVWVSQLIGDFPAWVAASPATFKILEPNAYVTGSSTLHVDTTACDSTAALSSRPSAIIGLRFGGDLCEVFGNGVALAGCLVQSGAGVWGQLNYQEGRIQYSGYSRGGSAQGVLPDTVAQDYGLIGGTTPMGNNRVGNAADSLYARTGAEVTVYGGYFASGLQCDRNGAFVAASKFHAGYVYCASQNWIDCSNYSLSGTSSNSAHQVTLGGIVKGAKFSLVDVPATGIPAIWEVSRGGFIRVSDSNQEGNNTGSSASRYGAWTKSDGMVLFEGAISDSVKAKSGRFRADGGRIEFGSTLTMASSEGAGVDCYVGPGASIGFADNVTKSATNPSGGGTAQPVIKWERGGRVTQASGKSFTLPAGSGNHTTDYGSTGAIDGDLMEACLGTLTGGGGGSTGVACTLRYGARLRHGGAGVSGTAPLKLGAAVAQAWPSNPKSDHGEANYEDCWVYPNV